MSTPHVHVEDARTRAYGAAPDQRRKDLLPENPEQATGLLRRRLRLRLRLLRRGLLLELRRRTLRLLRRRRTLLGRRRRCGLWRIGLRGDQCGVWGFAVGEPDVVNRMLDTVQAGARREHPARKNPLHLALQRNLIDLDKSVGVGGLGGRARIAGVGLHAQRAELDRLADVFVEIDDAARDLVEARKARLLVDDLLRRRFGDHLVAGL